MYGKLRLDGIRTLLNDACPSQMPGYGWSVVVEGRPTARGWGGSAVVEPEVHPVAENTLFDLASLTKPLATALIALMAHDSGELSLFEPLPATGPGPPTPLQLLRHEGGFPPWLPLYAYAGNEDEAFQWLLHSCPREPAGLKVAYSCLGYILLGLVLEKRLNASLPELFKSRVLDTLGLASDEAFFSPGGALLKRCAATELAGSHEAGMARQYGAVPPPFQNGVAWGEVHDGNARFLGGAAGNAGLFATLGATEKLCCAYRSGSRLLSTETFRLAWTSENAPSGFFIPVIFRTYFKKKD